MNDVAVHRHHRLLDAVVGIVRILDFESEAYREMISHSLVSMGNTHRLRAAMEKAERGEDVPIKTSDHCMDADRYFVHTILAVGRAKVGDKSRIVR